MGRNPVAGLFQSRSDEHPATPPTRRMTTDLSWGRPSVCAGLSVPPPHVALGEISVNRNSLRRATSLSARSIAILTPLSSWLPLCASVSAAWCKARHRGYFARKCGFAISCGREAARSWSKSSVGPWQTHAHQSQHAVSDAASSNLTVRAQQPGSKGNWL